MIQGYALYKRQQFSFKDTNKLKEREWEKVYHAVGNQKRAQWAIFISNKIDFKTKIVTKNKEDIL